MEFDLILINILTRKILNIKDWAKITNNSKKEKVNPSINLNTLI